MLARSVILVAGGSGTRMKSSVPKQFLKICDKPIIVHTIEAFLRFDREIRVILVLPPDHFKTGQEIYQRYFPGTIMILREGGATRFQSVKSGLAAVQEGLVAIHDAVRPFVPVEVIRDTFATAERTGSGVAMVPVRESIRKKAGTATRAEDRSLYYSVQTPQTFRVDLIKKAFEQDERPSFTDDASVYESAGMEVTPVTGDYRNIKITTAEDLLVASVLLA